VSGISPPDVHDEWKYRLVAQLLKPPGEALAKKAFKTMLELRAQEEAPQPAKAAAPPHLNNVNSLALI